MGDQIADAVALIVILICVCGVVFALSIMVGEVLAVSAMQRMGEAVG